MPIQVLMPALSPTMEKGNLAKWLKKEGDAVKSGDVIAEIETDKATMEVEAIDEGTLGKILVPEGTADVAVNTPIAVIWPTARAPPISARQRPSDRSRKPRESAPTAERSAGRRSRRQAESDDGRSGCADSRRRAGSRRAGRHRDGDHDRPRSAARRHGRGDAARRRRLRDGRGSRRIPGRLQGHAGPAAGIRRQARDRHADHRAWLCRRRRRRGDGRPEADRRIHDLQFRHAGDRPDHQFGGEDALHVRRPDGLLDRVPRPEWRRRPRRRPAQPGLLGLVFADPGPEGGRALYGRRRQGPAESRDPRSQPGDLPRKRNPLRPVRRGAEARRLRAADRQGADRRGRATMSPSSPGRSA